MREAPATPAGASFVSGRMKSRERPRSAIRHHRDTAGGIQGNARGIPWECRAGVRSIKKQV